MNRRNFLKTSALATLVSTTNSGALLAQEKPSKPESLPPASLTTNPPVLQNLSANAVTVFWRVDRSATGWIEFGETKELGSIARGAVNGLLPFDQRVLRVRLTGLQPGRKYFYRIQTAPVDFNSAYDIQRLSPIASPIYSFTTFDVEAPSASFTVWNDTHERAATLQKLAEQLQGHPSDFHLWNGDLFNHVQSEDAMVQQVLSPVPIGFAMERPFFLVRGNHDTRGAAARSLDRVIETPGNRPYYIFRHGPLAVLVLDAGEDKEDAHQEYGGLAAFADYRIEQQRWLEQAIAQPEFKSAPFRILFTHIPLRGPHCSMDSVAKWQSLISRARIDFAISGHTHKFAYYEPTLEQSFPLLVGGGPELTNATFIHARVTSEKLLVYALSIDGAELGHWEVSRKF